MECPEYWLCYEEKSEENKLYFELQRNESSSWDFDFDALCQGMLTQLLVTYHCYASYNYIMHQKNTFWCYKTVYKPVFSPAETISVLDDACCIGYSLDFDQAHYLQSLNV